MPSYAGPREIFEIDLPKEYGNMENRTVVARTPRAAIAAWMRETGHPDLYRTLMHDFDAGKIKIRVIH